MFSTSELAKFFSEVFQWIAKLANHQILISGVVYLAKELKDLERVIVVTLSPAEARESISESKHKQDLRKVREVLTKAVPKVKFEWGYAAFDMHDRYVRFGNGWTIGSGRGNDIFRKGTKMIDASKQYLCRNGRITYDWNQAHISDGGLGIGALQMEGLVR